MSNNGSRGGTNRSSTDRDERKNGGRSSGNSSRGSSSSTWVRNKSTEAKRKGNKETDIGDLVLRADAGDVSGFDGYLEMEFGMDALEQAMDELVNDVLHDIGVNGAQEAEAFDIDAEILPGQERRNQEQQKGGLGKW
eukprot:TRINITY_DN3982_c0_g2_i1.p1 TRINITY_DN3982_c0_g2~~TRINITY_DN3982_c0_g2_i1.p1  ORF type:complete len:137 (-),score=54.75 TRINITY_DN3982_c0_g2_i1:113-523(-)